MAGNELYDEKTVGNVPGRISGAVAIVFHSCLVEVLHLALTARRIGIGFLNDGRVRFRAPHPGACGDSIEHRLVCPVSGAFEALAGSRFAGCGLERVEKKDDEQYADCNTTTQRWS
ncbi:MAG: hypothetical protein R3A46_03100 [Thermomicrobiales bacterium]